MKRLKAKLMALLAAIGCCSVCLGAGVVLAQQETVNITAEAEVKTHNIGKLVLHVNSSVGGASGLNSALYLKRADGGALPVLSWEHLFVYESGAGFQINGIKKTPAAIKSTGDGFYWSFGALSAGDEITISGTFYCETLQTKYVIEKSSFVWNGTNWAEVVDVESYTSFTINEIGPANGCTATTLNAYPINDAKPSLANWDDKLTFLEGSGKGFCLNGTKLTGWEIKQPGDFYIVLGTEAKAGDILMLDGIFYNKDKSVKVVFNNSCMQYDGTAWASYGTADSYNVTKIAGTRDSTSEILCAYPVNEAEKPAVSSWDHAFSLRKGSGEGVTLNGDRLSGWEFKQPGDFRFVLGRTAVEGDVVTIDGIFYNNDLGAQIEFNNSTLQFDGAYWVEYKEVNITPIAVGQVKIGANSTATAVYFDKASDAVFEATDGEWKETLTYKVCSGIGVTLNGQRIVMDDIKIPNNIYVNLKTEAQVGDVLVISGEFYNETLGVSYAIDKSSFQWNGEVWVKYYDVYHVGKVVIGNGSGASAVYFDKASGEKFEVTEGTWTEKLTYESGVGVALNGTQIDMNDIKIPNNLYVALGATAKEGDILTIGGTFYNDKLEVKYVISNSKFEWNGTAWVEISSDSTYNIGKVVIGNGSSATAVYFDKASGAAFEVASGWNITWDYESGTGITLNGTKINMNDIKIPNNLYVALGTTAKTGDVLTIGGTFYNENLMTRYVIEDSKFEWNGTEWIKYIEYKTYNIGQVKIGNGSSATAVYFDKASGTAFEVTEGTWTEKLTYLSGTGVTLNGTQINMGDIKIPNNLFVGLGTTAKVGDILTIGGTFYNANLAVKYVIEDSKFEWNGTGWEKYVEYTTYNVGTVIANNDSAANAVYFIKENGGAFEAVDDTWTEKLTYESGTGVTLNGTKINMNDIKIPGALYVGLGKTAKVGDVLVIGGTFYNTNLLVKYVIEESTLEWNGTEWVKTYDESALADYDTITMVDLGVSASMNLEGTVDMSGLNYLPSSANTTGSVKFRFNYRSEDVNTGSIWFRFRGSAWDGVLARIVWGGIEFDGTEYSKLQNNTDYVIEIGVINLRDGSGVLGYVRLNGGLLGWKIFTTAFNTNHLSIYAESVAASTMGDPDHVSITYKLANDTSFTQYNELNSNYVITEGRTHGAFLGWYDETNDKLYFEGQEIKALNESLVLSEVLLDFFLDEGAAIRLSGSADESGIRFTGYLSNDSLQMLENSYNITNVSFGTLIIPYDYLGAGQAPNLEDFVAGENILKIESTYSEVEGDYVIFRGAMQKLYTENYERLFAGRAYIELTFASGETKIIYTPFSTTHNVRSIRYVAQQVQKDTETYNAYTANKQAVIDAYALSDQIDLMDYESYAANNVLDRVAWYYPELDPSNEYNNETNKQIAKKMKGAGITMVYLDGQYHLDLDTYVNIEKTRQIINFFWTQGLYTIAYASNAREIPDNGSIAIDYSVVEYPDFSDCEGFMGFLVWDEPSGDAAMAKLQGFAQNFEKTYAGTGVTFMANLLPSYASIFNGTANWWESGKDTLKKDTYKAYLQQYCDEVLSQISGEKWLSLDSYPIKKDKSLMTNFLFDLAMLKLYSINYEATSHIALQSSGWNEGSDTMNRMPTEAEMRMQAYAAMAFGIDSISWWSYANKRGDNQLNPTDSDDYYTPFAKVNNELAAISAVYSAFTWKGVILGAGKDNGSIFSVDNDYDAFALVMNDGDFKGYKLYASDTKHLASVATNKANWNYLMGVMEDMNGNEGYVLCNYNSHESDRAQTITLTFDSNITEVVIYRGGKAETVSVSNKTLAISLATGEGVIVLPSKLG